MQILKCALVELPTIRAESLDFLIKGLFLAVLADMVATFWVVCDALCLRAST